MINKIKKVKIKDILGFFILIVAIPIALFVKLTSKIKKKPIWLICELKDTCRDNGYHFFKYVRENHPNDNCYYAISKKCNDYKKISNMRKYYRIW